MSMINKAMIDKVCELPDEKMLAMLKIILSGVGVDISSKPIDEKTIPKIRALLEEVTDDDISRLTRLADVYKNGGKHGKR